MMKAQPAATLAAEIGKPSIVSLCLTVLAVLVGTALSRTTGWAADDIQIEFALPNTQRVILKALPYAGAALGAIIIAPFAYNRPGIRPLFLALGLATSAICAANLALATSLLELQALSAVAGIGFGLSLAAAIGLAAHASSARGRPLALALVGLAFMLGPLLPQSLLLASQESWRVLALWQAFAAIALAILILRVGRDVRTARQPWMIVDRWLFLLVVGACTAQAFTVARLLSPMDAARESLDLTAISTSQVIAASSGCFLFGLAATILGARLGALIVLLAGGSAVATLLLTLQHGGAETAWALHSDIALAVAAFAGGWFGIGFTTIIIAGHVSRAQASISTLVVLMLLVSFAAPVLAGPISDSPYGALILDLSAGATSLLFLGFAGARLLKLSGTVRQSDALHVNSTSLLRRAEAETPPPSIALRGFGVSTSESILLIGAFVFVLLMYVRALLTSMVGQHGWNTASAIALLASGGIWILASLGAYMRLLRKSKTKQQAELESVNGPYALYLRPFRFDMRSDVSAKAYGYKGPVTPGTPLEEALGALCLDVGLGIKSVGPVEGQFGLSAILSDDEDWKRVVSQLIDNASLIVMVPGPGEGCAWEVSTLSARADLLARTIWLMPPWELSAGFRALWDEVDRDHFPSPPPDYRQEGYVFAYKPSPAGTPRLETAPFAVDFLAKVISLTAREEAERVGAQI